jgi:hypothetical protein
VRNWSPIAGRRPLPCAQARRRRRGPHRDIRFAKTPAVLRNMGLDGLGKSAAALREIAADGLA